MSDTHSALDDLELDDHTRAAFDALEDEPRRALELADEALDAQDDEGASNTLALQELKAFAAGRLLREEPDASLQRTLTDARAAARLLRGNGEDSKAMNHWLADHPHHDPNAITTDPSAPDRPLVANVDPIEGLR